MHFTNKTVSSISTAYNRSTLYVIHMNAECCVSSRSSQVFGILLLYSSCIALLSCNWIAECGATSARCSLAHNKCIQTKFCAHIPNTAKKRLPTLTNQHRLACAGQSTVRKADRPLSLLPAKCVTRKKFKKKKRMFLKGY